MKVSNSRNDASVAKGKAIVASSQDCIGNEEMEIWRRFKEAGLLNEALLEKKGYDALVDKVKSLENELYDYQYNMGLLLIEKKEWFRKYEELIQEFEEMQETLKREQAANVIALRDVEKKEEDLRKGLRIEKQCVADLQKALNDLCKEATEVKFTSQGKMSEAQGLVSQTEHHSLGAEKKMNKLASSKQGEELRNWEKSLQERERRHAQGQEILNRREERTKENERSLKQKDENLKEAQKKIEMINLTLKKQENDIKVRLEHLAMREEDTDGMTKNVEMKEKELLALQEKLSAREKDEIRKALDDHNSIVGVKQQEFELEMDQKRKHLEEELKNKLSEVEQKEVSLSQREEQISKREQAVEKSLEKAHDLDSKWKAVREKEKAMQTEKKHLTIEVKQMLTDKENLQFMTSELDKERADIDEKRMKLHEELESLKVTEEERKEFEYLQVELEQEKKKCMLQEEQLVKEYEVLKQDKENFEREWELLDEKRAEIADALQQLCREKEELEKLRQSKEQEFKNAKLLAEDHAHTEGETVRQIKESLEASMVDEQLLMSDKAQSKDGEHQHMFSDVELQKRELKVDMQNRLEQMENDLLGKEKAFKVEKERELNNINHLREVAYREIKEMDAEKLKIEKSKEDFDSIKHSLEEQQLELQKDIENRNSLINKMKYQRRQLKLVLDKHKNCDKCGEVKECILEGLQSLQEMEDRKVHAPRLRKKSVKRSLQQNLTNSERLTEKSPAGNSLGFVHQEDRMVLALARVPEETTLGSAYLEDRNFLALPSVPEESLEGCMQQNLGASERLFDTSPSGRPSGFVHLEDRLSLPRVSKESVDGDMQQKPEIFERVTEAPSGTSSGSAHLEDREDISLPVTPKESLNGSMQQSVVTPERPTEIPPLGTSLGGRMSWFRKCTAKILLSSPFSISEDTVAQDQAEESPPSIVKVKIEESSTDFGDTGNEAEAFMGTPSMDVRVKDVKDEHTSSINVHNNLDSLAPEVSENSQHSQLKTAKGKPARKSRPGVKRARYVKAVVENVKIIRGEASMPSAGRQSIGNVEDSAAVNEASRKDDALASEGLVSLAWKGQHATPSKATTAEQDSDGSESHSDSVTTGVRKKMRRTIGPEPVTPSKKRYNFRSRK